MLVPWLYYLSQKFTMPQSTKKEINNTNNNNKEYSKHTKCHSSSYCAILINLLQEMEATFS
jgi:hypothetical protein